MIILAISKRNNIKNSTRLVLKKITANRAEICDTLIPTSFWKREKKKSIRITMFQLQAWELFMFLGGLYTFYWQQRFLSVIIKRYQHKALSEGYILYCHHFWLWHTPAYNPASRFGSHWWVRNKTFVIKSLIYRAYSLHLCLLTVKICK